MDTRLVLSASIVCPAHNELRIVEYIINNLVTYVVDVYQDGKLFISIGRYPTYHCAWVVFQSIVQVDK